MNTHGKVLLIDDEQQLRRLLFRLLSLEGFDVTEASNLKAGETELRKAQFDVVLCDVRLPDGNGVDFVQVVKSAHPTTEVILLTAFGNITDGVKAIKNGAFDYLQKANENDRIVPLLYQAVAKAKQQAAKAVKISNEQTPGFTSILGTSSQIHTCIQQAKKIAPTDATVLLFGETGTGKEVFANAIHHSSGRSSHAMVAINCSAFSRELLESELFGHKAGAFTGAAKDKRGLVEVADKGTLFLDEVGEMRQELQAKLLRFIENGEFIKVGDTKTSHVDVRLIAATNRNLEKEVKNGDFREDLFYRLNVFSIELPSLRTRPQDIPVLTEYFCRQFKPGLIITAQAMDLLVHYQWPGNIRELKNVLHRATILSEGGEILPVHFPAAIQSFSTSSQPDLSLADVERKHIEKILEHCNGNKTKAAHILGIGVATLYRKLDEYKL
jgi:two-component system, NtrC family, response regulator